jgi:hypothetical protein
MIQAVLMRSLVTGFAEDHGQRVGDTFFSVYDKYPFCHQFSFSLSFSLSRGIDQAFRQPNAEQYATKWAVHSVTFVTGM